VAAIIFRGEFAVLYTADSQFTALQKVKVLFLDEAGDLRGVPRNPDLVLTVECSLPSMLDLTDAGFPEQLGTSREELIAESPSRFIENARGRSTSNSTTRFRLFSQRSHFSDQGSKRSQSSWFLH
jgi:hypothetical protein